MIQATAILALVYCALAARPRRSAAERHALWAAALGAAALLPLLGVVLGAWQPSWARTMAEMFPAIVRTTSPSVSPYDADVVVHAGTLQEADASWVRVLALLWVVGAGVASIALLIGLLRLARLAKLARPVTDSSWLRLAADVARRLNIRGPVVLLQSPAVQIPITWGVRHPRVVLPPDATHWSDDRREAVLTHELAHIHRRDWLVQMLAESARAVYWFHPLFWLACHRLRAESEHACDDIVIGLGADAPDYATHLLHIVRAARADDRRWHAPLAMGRPSQLEQRFVALLATGANRRPVGGWRVAAIAGFTLASMIPLAAMGVSPFLGATIQVQTASLPPAIDAPLAPVDDHPTSAIRRVRTVDASPSGTVTAPEIVAYTTPPLYSDEARQRGIEGIVTIVARVGVDGHVSAPRVTRGLGFGLDQNALVALRQWQFRPGTENGVVAATTAEVDIEFNLRNEALNELIANEMATRIGPDVTAPRIVRRVSVRPSLDAGVERHAGTVVLDVVLLEDGRPKIVRVLQSVAPQLDERAIEAFEQWRFSPAMKAGRTVKVRLRADVTFH